MVLEAGMSVLSRGTSMAVVFFGGQGFGRQVQVPADGFGDLADGYAFFADGVEHCVGGSLLNGQPVGACGVFHVDGGPAAGPVADVAGDALGPAMAMSWGMKPWRSPRPCTERGSMTRQARTSRFRAAAGYRAPSRQAAFAVG